MTDPKKISFKILAINDLEFFIKNPKDFKLNLKSFRLSLNTQYRWNIENNVFGISTIFTYKSAKNIEYLRLSVFTEFKIPNLADIIIIHPDEKFEMDEALETNLLGIAISTGRGILYEKTKGTIFSELIFPAINTKNLVLSKKLKEK